MERLIGAEPRCLCMSDGDEGEAAEAAAEPPDGFVRVRKALLGVGLLWLSAISAFGTLQATIYGVMASPPYLAVAVGAAALSVGAGYASLRTFGYA